MFCNVIETLHVSHADFKHFVMFLRAYNHADTGNELWPSKSTKYQINSKSSQIIICFSYPIWYIWEITW